MAQDARRLPFWNADLPVEERIADLLGRLTLEEKCMMLTNRHEAIPRLGLKESHLGLEIARGHVSRRKEKPTTVFPQPIGMAAMFDPPLMEKLGRLAGVECRIQSQARADDTLSDCSGLITYGPTVDMERHPLWGRNEEAYGEDPYLSGKMTAAYTRGLRGDHPFYAQVIPGLKHFYANNNEEKRENSDSQIPPRQVYEYYHEPFRRAMVEGGAMGVMTAYNEINGVAALCNPELQTFVKDAWGGSFVMSDGADFRGNVLKHKTYADHGVSIAAAIKAGADFMLDDIDIVTQGVLAALQTGDLTEEDVNRTAANVLKLRFQLGEFDPDEKNPYAHTDPALLMCPAHTALNHRAACEQLVLLENDGILPLSEGCGTVAVIGPEADQTFMDWYTGYAAYETTIRQGLEARLGKERVLYDDGADRVTLRSCKTGQYLCVDESSAVYAADRPAQTWIYENWGHDHSHYRLPDTGRYLRAGEDGLINADGETPLEWFVRTGFRGKQGRQGLTLLTYDNRYAAVDAQGRLHAEKNILPDPLAARFTRQVVSSGAERAKALSAKADTVILCLGSNPMVNGRECADRPSLDLPESQRELLRAVASVNRRVVVVLVSSYPYAITEERGLCRAILSSSHAGPEMGHAVAKALLGSFNPAGRLPQSWYADGDDLPPILSYDIQKNGLTYLYQTQRPLYPFGYGLSYSSFAYEDAAFSLHEGCVRAQVTVRNTSSVAGDEVVQVYFHAVNPSAVRPLRQLCAFERRSIAPGESQRVTFDIPLEELRFWSVELDRFAVEEGEYEFMIGRSAIDIEARATLHVPGESIPARRLLSPTPAWHYDDADLARICWDTLTSKRYLQADEGGQVHYRNVCLEGAAALCCRFANPDSKGVMTVCADGQVLGSAAVPATASVRDVHELRVALQPTQHAGVLTLHLPTSACLYDIWLEK